MKKCVFCHRSPPEVKMSGEHVLRAKLAKILPSEGTHINWAQNYICPTSGELNEKFRKIPSGPFDQKVNDVCKECNEGWLNKSVELPCEQYIEPAILGQSFTTTGEARKYIALWASKTAAVRGLMDPKPRGIPVEHFQWIKEKLTPPPNTYVWLGKSQFTPLTVTRHLRFFVFDHNTDTATPCHITMFTIGFMTLFILGCTTEDGENSLHETIKRLDSEQIIRIWPNGVMSNTQFLPEMSKEHIYKLSSTDLPNMLHATLQK